MPKGFGEASGPKKRVIDSKNLIYAKEEKKAFRLFQENKIDAAITIYENIISSGYNSYDLHAHLGLIRLQQGNYSSAINSLERALIYEPGNIDALSKIAYSCHQQKDFKQSRSWYKKCIAIGANSDLLFFNYAELEKDAGEIVAAIKLYEKGIKINGNNFRALSNLGALYERTKDYPKAIHVYRNAIRLAPNISHLKVDLISCKSIICDWSDKEEDSETLKAVGLEGDAIGPFELMALEDDPAKHLARAKRFYQDRFKRQGSRITYMQKNKIRVGYFSSDFYRHATMYLMKRIFQLHDKNRFEIFVYSSSKHEDDFTELLRDKADVFRNIANMNDADAVDLARKDNLDIAVDLKGYTQGTRMGIFSQRTAPIQISYLGFPGSTGAECIDYLIADEIIIPASHQKFYSEKILYMPNTYQCNDDQRIISSKTFNREELGLSRNAFVFACFNANNKITHDVFSIWMNLLSRVEGSILWLYRSNYHAEINLKKEAASRGIDEARIVFANKITAEDHLARLKCADLMLDTFNYNAHTTASDALWAGIPIVTKLGESFASRVCSSLLQAVGLPELISTSAEQYERIALELAKSDSQLEILKSRLTSNLASTPLFDSKNFTNDLESIYAKLIQDMQ